MPGRKDLGNDTKLHIDLLSQVMSSDYGSKVQVRRTG